MKNFYKHFKLASVLVQACNVKFVIRLPLLAVKCGSLSPRGRTKEIEQVGVL